jgi:hypothetical protein
MVATPRQSLVILNNNQVLRSATTANARPLGGLPPSGKELQMSDFQYFLKWLSENPCLSVVLVYIVFVGLTDIARAMRRPTKDAPDLGESSASDSESKPAPKRVI